MLNKLLKDFIPIDIRELRPDTFYKDFMKAKIVDTERITNGSGWKLLINCPICSATERVMEFESHGTDIVRCPTCTHVYTYRVPVNPEEVYDSEEYALAVQTLELKQKAYRMNRFGKERAEMVKPYFQILTEQFWTWGVAGDTSCIF